MSLALECPERLIRIRVGRLCIGDSCEWKGITISWDTPRQFAVAGYGKWVKVGRGKMRLDTIYDQIVAHALAWHQAHVEAQQQLEAMWAARAAEIEARRKHRRASVPPAQLPLWGLV